MTRENTRGTWTPEDDVETIVHTDAFGKAVWDNMTVQERVSRLGEIGISGRLGSKGWDDLTPLEQSVIKGEQKPPLEYGYQIKAHVALEDSDKQSWGVSRDTGGVITWKLGEGEIIGTWSRSPTDGLIHVFLESSIAALVDKSVQAFAEYAEKRRAEMEAPKAAKAKTPRAPKAPKVKPEPEPSEAMVKIGQLRDLFKK